MSKVAQNFICDDCESDFKLSYHEDEVSGNSKFCPFCGYELFMKDVLEEFGIGSEDDE